MRATVYIVEFWSVIANIASIVTIVAFAIVVISLILSAATRPRVELLARVLGPSALDVTLKVLPGPAALRFLNVAIGSLDEHGICRSGDESIHRATELGPRDWLRIDMTPPPSFGEIVEHTASGTVTKTLGMSPGPTRGVIFAISWQSSVIPVIRAATAVAWSPANRISGGRVAVHRGLAARWILWRAGGVDHPARFRRIK